MSFASDRQEGVEIFIFLAAVYCIGHRPSKYRKSQIFYIVHGGILLALVTIEVAVDAMWGQFMWIDHRNYPGGPLQFLADSQFSWSFVLPFAASVAANIFSDGILVRSISPKGTVRVERKYMSNPVAHRCIDAT